MKLILHKQGHTLNEDDHRKTCPFCRGLHWHRFQSLESKLVDITKYVTLDETNSQTWGDEIADILVLTGNAMDTFFKDMRDCPNIREDENYLSINKPRKRWKIHDYQKVYEPYYELSQNSVYTGFGLGNAQTLLPFQNFSCIIPKWWTAYNTTKHEFYIKMNEEDGGVVATNNVAATPGVELYPTIIDKKIKRRNDEKKVENDKSKKIS